MYKPVIRNILTATWKNGLLGNSYKNNNALLFLILNGVQVNNLTSQLMQARSYRRIFRKDSNSELNSLLENLKDVKTVKAADEMTKIITHKDNETAKNMIEELCKDPEVDKRYKTLELEIDWWRQEARQVPDVIEPFSMLQLLQLKGTAKRKYLRYLYLTEKKRQSEERKKEKKSEKRLEWVEEKKEKGENYHVFDIENLEYRLEKNAMFLRVYSTTMNKLYNNNVMKSMMFGNKLILDCSYDNWMGPQEVLSCAKQITQSVSKNRYHDRPFDLHLCNAHKESKLMLQLKKCIPTLFDDDYPINITEKSYLDHFDKDKLCYLTPHCRQDLTHYDPETTYIIGAFVDKGCGQPMSLAKAKQDGLRMAKLPLDLYMDWGVSSSKSLTIDCVIKIMLDLQIEGNWEKAIKHVPSRKSKASREYVEKHALRPNKSKKFSPDWNAFDIENQNGEKREVDKAPQREKIELKNVKESEEIKEKENRGESRRSKTNAFVDGYGTKEESQNDEKKEDWQRKVQKKILQENVLKRIEMKDQVFRDQAEKFAKEKKENTKKFTYNDRMKKRQHWND